MAVMFTCLMLVHRIGSLLQTCLSHCKGGEAKTTRGTYVNVFTSDEVTDEKSDAKRRSITKTC